MRSTARQEHTCGQCLTETLALAWGSFPPTCTDSARERSCWRSIISTPLRKSMISGYRRVFGAGCVEMDDGCACEGDGRGACAKAIQVYHISLYIYTRTSTTPSLSRALVI